jgi:hypothetical protein
MGSVVQVTAATDLAAYIAANTSFTVGTDLYIGRIPDQSGTVAAVYELTSEPPVYTASGTGVPVLERPRVMVYVRANDYATARSTIETIWQLLQQVVNETLSGTYYTRVEAVGSPIALERDASDRMLFSANFQVEKELG